MRRKNSEGWRTLQILWMTPEIDLVLRMPSWLGVSIMTPRLKDTRQNGDHPGHRYQKVFCFWKSCTKTTLIAFLYCKRDVYKESVPEGKFINSGHNLVELKHLLEGVVGLTAGMQGWWLLQDNELAHALINAKTLVSK